MSKKDFSEIVSIVDRSGSMASIKEDAIGGFNTFLEEQKKVPGTANLTRVIFDTEYEIIDDNVPLDKVEPFNDNTFIPRGGTALLDALGKAVATVKERIFNTPEEEKPEKVIFAILTDGEENSSHEYRRDQIFDMIKEMKERHKWEFIFLAANQDAIQTGASYGFAAKDSMNFVADKGGTRAAMACYSSSVTRYRTGSDQKPDDDEKSDETKS